MRRGDDSASRCRANEWKAGDELEGTESWPAVDPHSAGSSTSRILLTAIGEEHVLAREVWRDGHPISEHRHGWSSGQEELWDLRDREWRRVDKRGA